MMNFTSSRHQSLFILCLFLSAATCAIAQEAQVETQQKIRERNQNVSQQESLTTAPADPELGDISLVSRKERPKMFTFFTTQSLNYTSNAFLVRDNEQDAFFWNGRLGASFVPYATRNFTPRLSFEQNFFRYDHLDQLNFDSQTLQLDLKYDLNRQGTWFVNGTYAVSRLYSPDDTIGEFYKYGLLTASITHLTQIGETPIHLAMTAGTYWRHGEPSSSDRITGYFNGLAIYNICETVQLAGFARSELQAYTNDPVKSNRTDLNVTVGTSLSWTPIQYLTVGATASYIGNLSSIRDRRYELALPSVIVAAAISF